MRSTFLLVACLLLVCLSACLLENASAAPAPWRHCDGWARRVNVTNVDFELDFPRFTLDIVGDLGRETVTSGAVHYSVYHRGGQIFTTVFDIRDVAILPLTPGPVRFRARGQLPPNLPKEEVESVFRTYDEELRELYCVRWFWQM